MAYKMANKRVYKPRVSILQLLSSFNDIYEDIRNYKTKIPHTGLGFAEVLM